MLGGEPTEANKSNRSPQGRLKKGPPRDIQVLIPGPVKVTFHGRKDCADVIGCDRVKDPEKGR